MNSTAYVCTYINNSTVSILLHVSARYCCLQGLLPATPQGDIAATSLEGSSNTPHLKDPAGNSAVSSGTLQGEKDSGRGRGEGQGKEWEVLLGEEGELADRLRKAIAKMKKLDDKLASVTKVCMCVCVYVCISGCGCVCLGCGWVGVTSTSTHCRESAS